MPISLSFCKQLLQESGLRASKGAAEKLQYYLESEMRRKARQAAQLARHAGRRTVLADDVEFKN
ncbi:histone [Candidatus Woesearchaeota archaeon CG_4_10_14_0_2_um_filter_57_5]|nr:MAG: hypothetical protein AUJ68_03110 [Candidatus Woesearchaeota archaeon CG1_02_57_44]PIZ48731.1 MAG: histone [Candidatus Woesearchaeota archaeon CG_4_10_14_0_2_um_filter_57_5]